jgi:hypothetical protein
MSFSIGDRVAVVSPGLKPTSLGNTGVVESYNEARGRYGVQFVDGVVEWPEAQLVRIEDLPTAPMPVVSAPPVLVESPEVAAPSAEPAHASAPVVFSFDLGDGASAATE